MRFRKDFPELDMAVERLGLVSHTLFAQQAPNHVRPEPTTCIDTYCMLYILQTLGLTQHVKIHISKSF